MNVEFDDNQREQLYAQIAESNRPRGVAAYLLDKGFAKDEKQATNIMSIGALIIIGGTAYIVFSFIL